MKEKELRIKLLENEIIKVGTEAEYMRLAIKATQLDLESFTGQSYLNISCIPLLPLCFDLSDGRHAPCNYCVDKGYKIISVQQYLSRFTDYKPAMGDWVWVSEEDPEAKVQKRLFVTGHGCVALSREDEFYDGNAIILISWKFITPVKDEFPKPTTESDALKMAISVLEKAKKDVESAKKQIELINKN